MRKRDLEERIERINKGFGKSNRSNVKLELQSAYGGHQVVIRDNYRTSVTSLTNGYQSPNNVSADLDKLDNKYIAYRLNRATKRTTEYKKDIRSRGGKPHNFYLQKTKKSKR